MAPRVSPEVLAAIAAMKADPTLTAWKAAQQVGVHRTTLYNSKLYKELCHDRNVASGGAHAVRVRNGNR